MRFLAKQEDSDSRPTYSPSGRVPAVTRQIPQGELRVSRKLMPPRWTLIHVLNSISRFPVTLLSLFPAETECEGIVHHATAELAKARAAQIHMINRNPE